MKTKEFAVLFETLYRATYAGAVRRVVDKRHRLSPETTGFLTHLSTTGPMTLSELARHTGRAQSTMSEMVSHLIAKNLLERDRDPEDARRTLIWLSKEGHQALAEAMAVLDPQQLQAAATTLTSDERAQLATLLQKFNSALNDKGKSK